MNNRVIDIGDNTAIVELTKRKHQLEHAIAKLIEEFSAENGVIVEDASLEHDPPMMNQQGDILNRIRYSIELRVWL